MTRFAAATFDCYGTLIDWQTGIRTAAGALFAAVGEPVPADLFTRFAEHERTLEAGPYRRYREVLREVAGRLTHGRAAPPACEAFAASVPAWPAFAEAPAALARIRAVVGRIAVVSNVDNELFEAPGGTRVRLGTPIDALVTAEEVKSYKPGRAHFRRALEVLKLGPGAVLHVAESRYHDIEPAGELGLATVWIDRSAGGASASGRGVTGREPDWTFRTLSELADALEAGRVA